MRSVLFVCLGNICRSPALEATLRHLAVSDHRINEFKIASCGISWMHVGEHPDPRTFAAASKRGILIDHRAQQFQVPFFDEYQTIFVVDREIADQVKFHARSESDKNKVLLATTFSHRFKDQDIPDPYYLSHLGFDQVMDMIIDSCEGILNHFYPDNY
jgi:protein-tyrosine phosphatase